MNVYNPFNTWKLNDTLLYKLWVKEKVSKEIKENRKKRMIQCINICDVGKAALREKFIAQMLTLGKKISN